MDTVASQTPAAPQTAQIAAALRDVAFVLQMTRRVKAAILAERAEPKPATQPAAKAEHAVGV